MVHLWKDITSYSRGDEERIPTTFELDKKVLRICVTSGHRDYKHSWIMHCYQLQIDTRELSAKTLEKAQIEAVKIANDCLNELKSSLVPKVEIKTEEDLVKRIRQFRYEYEAKCGEVKEEFVKNKCKFRKGDIIEDTAHRIQIEKIRYSTSDLVPTSIYYRGVQLTRKNKPFKNKESMTIFEERAKEVKLAVRF